MSAYDDERTSSKKEKLWVGPAFCTVAVLLGLIILSTRSFAATQTIGDVESPAEGNLKIVIHDEDTGGGLQGMEVWRFVDGYWEYQFYSEDSKGARLLIDSTGYDLGYFKTWGFDGYDENEDYFTTDDDITATPVSNTKEGDSRITTVRDAGPVRVTQVTTYEPGADYYGMRWTIENRGDTTLDDLRFFHGGDTYFQGDDSGGGFWDASNNTVGVQHTNSVTQEIARMSLQGATTPVSYESRGYWQMGESVAFGALTDAIDPDEDTDNGYALEWRQASLAPGGVWTIQAYEKFGETVGGGPLVFAPTQTDADAGAMVDLIFTVENTGVEPMTTELAVVVDLAGWQAEILNLGSANDDPLTIIIPETGSRQATVTVRVTVPAAVQQSTVATVTLFATANEITASDNAAVKSRTSGQVGGIGVESYRLVSVARNNVSGDTLEAAIDSGVPSEMTYGTTGDIRILSWNALTQGYEELLGEPPAFRTMAMETAGTTDLAGHAFWRIVRADQGFSYDGDEPPAEPFLIVLQPEWNVFGFPFADLERVNVSDLEVSADGEVFESLIGEQMLTGQSVWEYEDRDGDGRVNDDATDGSEQYDRTDYIGQGFGYWLYVKALQPVYLKVPYLEGGQGGMIATGVSRTPFAIPSVAVESPPPAPPVMALAEGGTASGGGGTVSGCFIATAAYGSLLHPYVKVLRQFRDVYLLSNVVGKQFVDFYYRYGPAAAEVIAGHRFLRFLTRLLLLPLIGFSGFMLYVPALVKLAAGGGVFLLVCWLVSRRHRLSWVA